MSEAELCPLEKKKQIHVLVCFVVTWGNLHRYGSWITGYVSHGGMATHQPSTILGYFVAFL